MKQDCNIYLLLLQDTYDGVDDALDQTAGDDGNSEHFYDATGGDKDREGTPGVAAAGATTTDIAPTGSLSQISSEVRINMDPTERLIEAVETLRDAINENTQSQRPRRRGGGPGGGGGRPPSNAHQHHHYKANGTPQNVKDERLKIRKEKVSHLNMQFAVKTFHECNKV